MDKTQNIIILGAMEILCINTNASVYRVDDISRDGWCTSGNNQKLLVGDWNGDRFTDLLCQNQTGHMKILLNQAG